MFVSKEMQNKYKETPNDPTTNNTVGLLHSGCHASILQEWLELLSYNLSMILSYHPSINYFKLIFHPKVMC